MQRIEQLGRVMMLCGILMTAAACQTTATPISGIELRLIRVEDVCRLFPERDYSRHDTIETRRHIVGDNAAKRELCKEP